MKVKGGLNIFGFSVGILMLDTRFPRIPGDMGNATTFDFPVLYHRVTGASPVVRSSAAGLPVKPLPRIVADETPGCNRMLRNGRRLTSRKCSAPTAFSTGGYRTSWRQPGHGSGSGPCSLTPPPARSRSLTGYGTTHRTRPTSYTGT